MWSVVLVTVWALLSAAAPTLDDIGGRWTDMSLTTLPFQRDLPTINNFYGSAGINPQGISCDIFAINGLEFPPLAGCGSDGHTPGCGTLRVDGYHPRVNFTRWRAYEASRNSSITPTGLLVTTTIRLPFERLGVFWTVTVQNVHNISSSLHSLEIDFFGMVREESSLGWTYPLPTNPNEFTATLVNNGSASFSRDSKSSAGGIFGVTGSTPPTSQTPARMTWDLHLPKGGSAKTFHFYFLVAHDVKQVDLPTEATIVEKGFKALWDAARDKWEARWQAAFIPGNSEYSGNLPTLNTADNDLLRIYYMAALSVISLQRTNLPLVYPRVYTTAEGNAFLHRPNIGIGGSRQWFWDASLHSILNGLLDPLATRADLKAVLSFDYHEGNGITLDNYHPPNTTQLGFYAFNPWSYFLSVSGYLRVTNDTEFLYSHVRSPHHGDVTVSQLLGIIALDWENYVMEGGSQLSDYGPSPLTFLECVPTYIHAVPAIQANNIWMLRMVGDLRERQGNKTGAQWLRDKADAISKEMLDRMYVKGGGYYGCIYPGNTTHPYPHRVEVRHVVDFFSVGVGMCGMMGCDVSMDTRREMVRWFLGESVTRDWIRALSPLDSLRYIARTDHGTTGAYDAWPALAIEALGFLEGHYRTALSLLKNLSYTTYEGPFGQAHQVPQEDHPPYTPYNNKHTFKPTLGETRYIADNGGSFLDTILRAFFGYNPSMVWGSVVDDTILHHPGLDRSLVGRIENLRTPGGLVTIVSGPKGLSLHKQ